MKKRMIALLSAIGYFALFFGLQIVFTFLISAGYGVAALIRALADGADGSRLELYMGGMEDLISMVGIVSGGAAILAVLLLFSVRHKSFTRETGWNAVPVSSLLSPFAVGFGLSAISSLLIGLAEEYLPGFAEELESYSENMAYLEDGNAVLTFLATVIAAPFAEELIFRGLIYTRFRRGWFHGSAIIFTGLFFGIAHGNLVQMLYTIPLGMLMCVFYDRYRSLWGCIALHMGFNLAGFAMSYLPFGSYVYFGVSAVMTVVGFVLFGFHKTEIDDETWFPTIRLNHPRPQPLGPADTIVPDGTVPSTASIFPEPPAAPDPSEIFTAPQVPEPAEVTDPTDPTDSTDPTETP